MQKLLVVEDVAEVRDQLRDELGKEYEVLCGTDRADAMELFLKHSAKVVLLDLSLPPTREGDAEGLHCLEWMASVRPATKVVVLASSRERESVYRALGRGAYDYHLKPVDPAELRVVIRRAFHLCAVEEQSWQLRETLERTTAGIQGIAGQCIALQRLFAPRQEVPFAEEPSVAEAAAQPPLTQGGDPAAAREIGGVRLPAGQMTLKEARDRVEKWMVTDAIGNCGGNMTKASELLGVSRPALYDLMKKYGLCRSGARG